MGDKKKVQPLVDKITLDPLEKYVKYDKYPTKMLIHVVLLALATAQILLVVNYTGGYARTAMRVWFRNFLGKLEVW